MNKNQVYTFDMLEEKKFKYFLPLNSIIAMLGNFA